MSETNPHNQGTSVTLQKLAGVLTRGQVLKVVTKLTLRVTSCTRKSKRTPIPSSFTKNRTKTCQSNRLKGMSRASSQQYLRHRGTCVKGRQALPWKWVDLWAARMFIGGSNNFPSPVGRTGTYPGLLPALLPTHRAEVGDPSSCPWPALLDLVVCGFQATLVP